MDESLRKKAKQISVRGFSDPWANLASAVIHSAVQCHDDAFFKSKWGQTLLDLVEVASEIDDHKYNGIRTGSQGSSRSCPGGSE